uniref:Large ribosomal subunit protein uL29m n=1 Tax=Daphnia pulicaria TaxID=35523 RepID=A0A4Y7MYQ7_9CRUS|nr:EOG090X0DBE [Daphnia pulicaria]
MAASVRNKLLTCVFSFGRILNQQTIRSQLSPSKCFQPINVVASIHTTSFKQSNLMAFFDDPKNFGAQEVKSGRSWTLDELRIKSNVDLQKLWFVLLKERNMLFTMEHNCREDCRLFPSPERIDKVQDSMRRIEEIVHERNDAFWQLEIGEKAPNPRAVKTLDPDDPLATVREAIEAVTQVKDGATLKFQYLMKEKELKMQDRKVKLHEREAAMLLKRFPNLDKEALQAKYPDVNIQKLKFNKKTRGSHEFNTV